MNGLSKFEARSSLRTWIFSILINQAKTRAIREQRTVPFSLFDEADYADAPTVDERRFFPAEHPDWPRAWAAAPEEWLEERLLSEELSVLIRQAIDMRPANQRMVIILRDIDGLAANEVCSLLDVTEANQRVLLHRARASVRMTIEPYCAGKIQ